MTTMEPLKSAFILALISLNGGRFSSSSGFVPYLHMKSSSTNASSSYNNNNNLFI